MCGIAGFFASRQLDSSAEADLDKMLDRLHHRGPDGRGLWRAENVLLGHLIPAGTGTMRMAELAAKRAPNDHHSNIQPYLRKYFENIAMAEVAESAAQGKAMGYLAEHAPVIMNSDRRLYVAKQEVLRLSGLIALHAGRAERTSEDLRTAASQVGSRSAINNAQARAATPYSPTQSAGSGSLYCTMAAVAKRTSMRPLTIWTAMRVMSGRYELEEWAFLSR